MLSYQVTPSPESNIAIIGLGGAGANVLQCFGSSSADNVRLCSMSLDERVGRSCGNVKFLQLGGGLNHGLGSGGDPEVGRSAAMDSRDQISALIEDVRLVVMVVGLGGGTGSGAAPVLAELARERGIFLVSVVLMPFAFEGQRRRAQADRALNEISRLSDIVFCFENDYMEELFHNRSGARAVFEEVDRLLAKATASVPTLANSPGLINLGLDELAVALANNDSRCLFGSGSGYGPKRAKDAAQAALKSPLVSYRGALRFARTVIVHIAGGDTMSLAEIRIAMETIRAALADEDVNIFFGTSVKARLGDEMRVTLIASIDSQEFKFSLLNPPVPEVVEEPEVQPASVEEPPSAPAAPAEPEDSLPEEAVEDEPLADVVPEEPVKPEPAPAPAAPAPSALHQGMLLGDDPAPPPARDEEEGVSRAQRLFSDDDEEEPAPATSRYKGAAAQPRRAGEDDLDTPPSLRFNDFSNLFEDK